jgi:hypothetical protein
MMVCNGCMVVVEMVILIMMTSGGDVGGVL